MTDQLPTGDLSADLNYQKQTRNAVRGIAVLACIGGMYLARDFLLPVILAIFVALTLRPIIKRLDRSGIPAFASALVFVVIIISVILVLAYVLSGSITAWIENAPQYSKIFADKFSQLRGPLDTLGSLSQKLSAVTEPTTSTQAQEVVIRTSPVSSLLGLVTGYPMQIVITLSAAMIIAVFMMASGDLFYEKLVRIMPTLSSRKRALKIAYDIENAVSSYVFTITTINAIFGVLIAVFYYFLGMPMPILWGAMAFAFNFFPYVGALTALGLSTFMAIVTFDQLGYALLVPATYIVISLGESEILRPQILGRSFQMNAVAILLALAFFTWLWGIAGTAIAVPLLLSVKILCDNSEEMSGLSQFISSREADQEQVVAAQTSST